MSGKLLLGSRTGKVHIGYLRRSRRFGPGVEGQVLDSCCATLVTPCGNSLGMRYPGQQLGRDSWICDPTGAHRAEFSLGYGLYNVVLDGVTLSGACVYCHSMYWGDGYWRISHQPNTPINGTVLCVQPGLDNRFAQAGMQIAITQYGDADCAGSAIRTITSTALVVFLNYDGTAWRLLIWYEFPMNYGGSVIVFDQTLAAWFVAQQLTFTNPNTTASCSDWYYLSGGYTELALIAGLNGTAGANGILPGAASFWARSTSSIRLMDNVGKVVQTADNCYQVVRRGLTHAPVTDLDIQVVYEPGECRDCGCALAM